MYLAPINYDRFFQRVFQDLNVAKQFLEDLLNVTIESIEYLARKNKITDDASFVEFDFRCKINGQFVIVDMQQWYKQDVVKRFYMYFCNNTTLQLENIPSMSLPLPNDKEYKTKNYSFVEPSITIVWMVDDTLGFKDDIVSFSMFPEMMNDFICNDKLWRTNNHAELLKMRTALIKKLKNKKKGLDFLSENRLIYAFQPNIVKNEALMSKHYPWFDFAERTRNKQNKQDDFVKFYDKPIFMTIMEKLMVTNLPQDDFQYITDYAAYQRRLAVYNAKVEKEALEKNKEALEKANEKIRLKDVKIFQVEQYSKKIEQEKEKAEQEKEKLKDDHEKRLITSIKKLLKRGDSFKEVLDILEIDMPTLERLLEKAAFKKGNADED